LAVAIYDHLCQRAAQHLEGPTCVAHFYFQEAAHALNRDDHVNGMNRIENAINSIVVQIAEFDQALCQEINAEMSREDSELDLNDWKATWSLLVKPLFKGEGKRRLQIVLDGFDELLTHGIGDDVEEFLVSLKEETDCRLQILCTARTELVTDWREEGIQYPTISIEKKHQMRDMSALIWKHLDSDQNLRRFGTIMKQKIAKVLEKYSPGKPAPPSGLTNCSP